MESTNAKHEREGTMTGDQAFSLARCYNRAYYHAYADCDRHGVWYVVVIIRATGETYRHYSYK